MQMPGVRTLTLLRFCLLVFALTGCQAPPPLHNLQLWDGNCRARTEQPHLAPRLSSLLPSELKLRQREIAAQLQAPVPRTDLLKLALDLHPELRMEATAGISRADLHRRRFGKLLGGYIKLRQQSTD